MTVGEELVVALSDIFWFIDGQHKTLADRSHTFPDIFRQYINIKRKPLKTCIIKSEKTLCSSVQNMWHSIHEGHSLVVKERKFAPDG